MAIEAEEPDTPVMDAVILAGGKGTRLQTAISDVPKPMARVNGRPFLDYQLIQLARSPLVGGTVLALGYLAHKVVEHYTESPSPTPLTFVVEDNPLGTGGAVRHAMSALAQPLVLVMNGDSLFDLDVAALYQAHRHAGRDATIALLDVPDTSRYGHVTVDGDLVTAFREKTGVSEPGTINAGVYLFERSVLAAIPEGEAVSMEHVVLPALVAAGRLTAAVFLSDFIDIGLPETYRAADAFTTKLFGAP